MYRTQLYLSYVTFHTDVFQRLTYQNIEIDIATKQNNKKDKVTKVVRWNNRFFKKIPCGCPLFMEAEKLEV